MPFANLVDCISSMLRAGVEPYILPQNHSASWMEHLAKLSTTVSIYLKYILPPLTWAVRTPSRYEVDSSLPKAIRAPHTVVFACDTFPVCHFPGDCILLFKMPWVWVMAAETKLERTSMCITQPSFYKWRNTPCHTLNMQMSTNI